MVAVRVAVALLVLTGCSSSPGDAGNNTPQSHSAAPGLNCPNAEGGKCLGPLVAGTSYGTQIMHPTVTYSVPVAGWQNFEDTPGNFLLVPPGNNLQGVNAGTSDFIGIYTSVVGARYTGGYDCEAAPVADLARTPQAIVAYFKKQQTLVVSRPIGVMLGGLSGLRVDIRMTPRGVKPCKLASGDNLVYVPLIYGSTPSSLDHGVIPGMTFRLYLLSFENQVLAVEVDDIDKAPGTLASLSAVVKNLKFSR